MDYSPQAKHIKFPFTEVFVQIAETQNQYVVCVCLVREKNTKILPPGNVFYNSLFHHDQIILCSCIFLRRHLEQKETRPRGLGCVPSQNHHPLEPFKPKDPKKMHDKESSQGEKEKHLLSGFLSLSHICNWYLDSTLVLSLDFFLKGAEEGEGKKGCCVLHSPLIRTVRFLWSLQVASV